MRDIADIYIILKIDVGVTSKLDKLMYLFLLFRLIV